VKVTEEKARALLLAVGYANAATYAIATLERRLQTLGAMPESERKPVADPALRRLMSTLIQSTRTEPVEVVPAVKPKRDGRVVDTEAEGAENILTNRRKGHQYHIFQRLKLTSAREPVTRQELRAYAEANCYLASNRLQTQLASALDTFPSWLPVRYPGYEVVVVRGGEAFYLTKEGT
jgi:hypothetical protein